MRGRSKPGRWVTETHPLHNFGLPTRRWRTYETDHEREIAEMRERMEALERRLRVAEGRVRHHDLMNMRFG